MIKDSGDVVTFYLSFFQTSIYLHFAFYNIRKKLADSLSYSLCR